MSQSNADFFKAFAKLNLTAEQKTKLEAAQEQCKKTAARRERMEKFMQATKSVLTREQFAQMP
ncbi:MAG TPA: hypothetical protein VIL63_00010 [Terriglobales bacterium]